MNTDRKIRVGTGVDIAAPALEQFWISQLNHSERHTARGRMYGSGAAFCPRQNFLNSRDEFDGDELWHATSQLYMAIGTGLEQALVDGLYRNGRLLFNNLTMPKCDPDIGGKIDLVYHSADDKIAIAEVKSCGELPIKPKPEHMAQLLTYSAIAGYDDAQLIYLSRNVRNPRGDLMIKVFVADTGAESLLEVLRKISLSQLAINGNFMPRIPANFARTTTCKFCNYNQFCWEPTGFEPVFYEPTSEEMAEYNEAATEWAAKLFESRTDRHVASLRHLFRNTSAAHLKGRIIKEIEKYETF